ncbi:MAG: DUF2868 domain-containing protein [Caldimonas sp.]
MAMTMDEQRAREATLLEAFETAQPASPSWSEDDRAWADRVALEAAAPGSAPAAFVSTRAGHAMQRLGSREPTIAGAAMRPAWRAGGVALIALGAFVLGVVGDAIGSGQRINLLAPPHWGVLLWNAVVYVLLIVLPLLRLARRTPTRRGRWVAAVDALLRVRQRLPRLSAGGSAAAIHRFASLWTARSRRLTTLRGEAALHIAAAALALGLITGLYARGLVLDYRVGWESTLLGADSAHAIVATLLAPASALSGIAVPDAAAFASLQTAHGDGGVGAPAASWIHLVALTLALFVVLPRVVLALICAAAASWRSRRFTLPLAEPYYQRLARLGGGTAARVVVFPFAATPTPQATLGLRTLLSASLGARTEMRVAPLVPFGQEDDAAAASMAADTTHAVALFDLGATPEAEHQSRFLRTLAAALPPGAVLAVLVDATAFSRRFAGLDSRLAERRETWRVWGDGAGVAPLVVDLEAADVAEAQAQVQAAFTRPQAAAAA